MGNVAKSKGVYRALASVNVVGILVIAAAVCQGGEDVGAMVLGAAVSQAYASLTFLALANGMGGAVIDGTLATASRVRSWIAAILLSTVIVMLGVYSLGGLASGRVCWETDGARAAAALDEESIALGQVQSCAIPEMGR